MSTLVNNAVDIINTARKTFNPHTLETGFTGANYPAETEQAAFISELNAKTKQFAAAKQAEYITNKVPVEQIPALVHAAVDAKLANDAKRIQLVNTAVTNSETTVDPNAASSVFANVTQNAMQEAMNGGNVMNGITSALRSGITGVIMSLGWVKNRMAAATEYFSSMFTENKITFDKALENVQTATTARAIAETLAMDANAVFNLANAKLGALTAVSTTAPAPQSAQPAPAAQTAAPAAPQLSALEQAVNDLNTVKDNVLSREELAVKDRPGPDGKKDNKLSKEEVNNDVLFAKLLEAQGKSVTNDPTKDLVDLDPNSFVPIQTTPLVTKPAAAAPSK